MGSYGIMGFVLVRVSFKFSREVGFIGTGVGFGFLLIFL